MTITEAEMQVVCGMDALPSVFASTNFAKLNTLVIELAGDDRGAQIALAYSIIMQVKEGASLSEVIATMGKHPPLQITRG